MSESLDPLPTVLPPEGVAVTRLGDIVAPARSSDRVDVAGVRGSADALLVAALARETPVLALVEDEDAARRFASDVGFLLPRAHEEDVLVLSMPESSPFADVNPDRRAAMARMATLGYLASGRPFRVLVAPAVALSRKLVPPDVVRAHTYRVQKDRELDRDKRKGLYEQADRILAERGPAAFTILTADYDAVAKNVNGYRGDSTPNFSIYKYLWIDQD